MAKLSRHNIILRVLSHLWRFPIIFGVVIAFWIASILIFSSPDNIITSSRIIRISLLLFFVLFIIKPMNSVYGLIGTRGSLGIFVGTFILFSVAFSIIYYKGFFKNAGISYDVNQPHVLFRVFDGKSNEKDVENKSKSNISPFVNFKDLFNDRVVSKEFIKTDTLFIEGIQSGNRPFLIQTEKKTYQRITYEQVLQNTILTSLMQEPTDFFATVATYNKGEADKGDLLEINGVEVDVNEIESMVSFHWILIFQILISWIFFGVFISILYNKFRYES